jgi:hypothetical protein
MSVLVAFRDIDGGGLTRGGRPEANVRRLIPGFLVGIFHDAFRREYYNIKKPTFASILSCPGGLESSTRQVLGIFSELLQNRPYHQIPDLFTSYCSCREFNSCSMPRNFRHVHYEPLV